MTPSAQTLIPTLSSPAQTLGESDNALQSLIDRSTTLCEAGRRPEAIALCEQALAQFPQSAALWSELGSNYLEAGALQAAELGFRTALQFAPGHPELLFNVSVALQKQWKFEEALPLLQDVVGQMPEHHKAWSNLAGALGWQGRYEEQMAALERALALAPDDASYLWNRSLANLRLGRFTPGWADYEARYRTLPRPPTPRNWSGEPIPSETLWVACEQGLGDTLQFLRFLPWARARVGRLVLACPTALKPFLEAQQCADEVLASDGTPPPGVRSIRLLSLPQLMGLRAPDEIPLAPYLRADDQRVAAMTQRFSRHRPLVALSWQGSKTYGADSQRSMPLQHLIPVLRSWDANFVSVQKGEGSEQLATLPADLHVEPLRPEDDAEGAFLDTAAILHVCDLFITTDSAVAHLAGGLGVPTRLLLPFSPDWRWGTREQPLRWYQSVEMKFQERAGEWDACIDGIKPPIDSTASRGTGMGLHR
jgi:tetratricopeptide (TPR) repeat protein